MSPKRIAQAGHVGDRQRPGHGERRPAVHADPPAIAARDRAVRHGQRPAPLHLQRLAETAAGVVDGDPAEGGAAAGDDDAAPRGAVPAIGAVHQHRRAGGAVRVQGALDLQPARAELRGDAGVDGQGAAGPDDQAVVGAEQVGDAVVVQDGRVLQGAGVDRDHVAGVAAQRQRRQVGDVVDVAEADRAAGHVGDRQRPGHGERRPAVHADPTAIAARDRAVRHGQRPAPLHLQRLVLAVSRAVDGGAVKGCAAGLADDHATPGRAVPAASAGQHYRSICRTTGIQGPVDPEQAAFPGVNLRASFNCQRDSRQHAATAGELHGAVVF